jgi:hypothetical protein
MRSMPYVYMARYRIGLTTPVRLQKTGILRLYLILGKLRSSSAGFFFK